MSDPDETTTVLPASDPRFVRVRRRDGVEFELPADMAAQLGLRAPVAPAATNVPALDLLAEAAPPPAPTPAPARTPAAPAAPAQAPALAPIRTPLTPEQRDLMTRWMRYSEAQTRPGSINYRPGGDPDLEREVADSGLFGVPPDDPRATAPEPTRPVEAPLPAFGAPTEPEPEPVPAAPVRPLRGGRRRAPEPPREPTEEERNASLIDQLTARPLNDAPLVPEDFRTSDPLEQEQGRIDEARQLAQQAAHNDAVAAAERQDILLDAQRQQLEMEREREAAMADATRRYLDAVEEARNTRIDPSRLFRDRGAAGAIGVAIATALGGLGAALTGGPNRALETIERAIDRDIAAQESNQRNAQAHVGNVRTFYDMARQRFADRESAQHAARALAWQSVAERAAQQQAQLRDAGAQLRARELQAEATQRAMAAQQQAIVAAQDRALAVARQQAETRRLNAQAARDERRAGGGGGAGAGRSPNVVAPRDMGTDADPLIREWAAAGRAVTPGIRAQAADAQGGSRSQRNLLWRTLNDTREEQGQVAPNVEPIDTSLRWTTRDVNVINAMSRAHGSLAAARRRFDRAYRRLQERGVLGRTWESVMSTLRPDQQREARAELNELNSALSSLRAGMIRVMEMPNTQGIFEQAEHEIPRATFANIGEVRDAFDAYYQAKLEEANAALEASNARFRRGGGHGGDDHSEAPRPPGGAPRGESDRVPIISAERPVSRRERLERGPGR